MELSCPLGISRLVPQDQRSFFGVLSHIINPIIDQACSEKMVGYWPRSFFACLWTQKKNEANIWPHTWSITHIYYMTSSVSGQDEPNRAL